MHLGRADEIHDSVQLFIWIKRLDGWKPVVWEIIHGRPLGSIFFFFSYQWWRCHLFIFFRWLFSKSGLVTHMQRNRRSSKLPGLMPLCGKWGKYCRHNHTQAHQEWSSPTPLLTPAYFLVPLLTFSLPEPGSSCWITHWILMALSLHFLRKPLSFDPGDILGHNSWNPLILWHGASLFWHYEFKCKKLKVIRSTMSVWFQ